MAPLPPVRDLAVSALVVVKILFIDVPFLLVAYTYARLTGMTENWYHDVSLGNLIQPLFIRQVVSYAPITFTRFVTDLDLPRKILESPRYKTHSKNLYSDVNREGFKGVWMVRNGFDGSDPDPTNSDIVIYHLHGGGYCSSSAASYTLLSLRLAESILRAGKSVSIFALDYDLAPEATWPRQLTQAVRVYDWLIGTKKDGGSGIDASKIIIIGDSAGGHLALSLLVELWRNKKTRPSGLLMMSPWLSLNHVPDSYKRNASTDFISEAFINDCVSNFTGSDRNQLKVGETTPWVDWIDAKGAITWTEVLPNWVWVSAGKHEIFYDHVVRWVKDRENDCPGKRQGRKGRIQSELDKNELHVYAWWKTQDAGLISKFCNRKMNGDDDGKDEFEDIERLGVAIVEGL